nr:PKD domain protein [uncultured bacterium]
MVSSPYYDNQHWEYHLPVNPPFDPENHVDVDGNPYTYVWRLDRCDLANWDFGTHVGYRPRLKESAQWLSGPQRIRKSFDESDWDEALDHEYGD